MTDERPTDAPDQPIGDSPASDAADPADAAAGSGEPAASAADTGAGTGYSADTSSSWSSFPSDTDPGTETPGAKMLSQLQAMIDSIATQASPVARQIGLKAAELTAAAADRAGPLAHRAGDVAADASGKLAVRSREFADAMRRELGVSDNGAPPAAADTPDPEPASTATAVLDRPVDEVVDEVNRKADDAG